MNNFTYDIELLNLNKAHRNESYLKLTKSQFISKLCIFYHCIEKGLALPEPKYNFGHKSGVLNTIFKMNEIFIKRFGNSDKILKMIYDSIEEYYNYHVKNNVSLESNYVEVYLKKYKYLKDNDNNKYGGTKTFNKNVVKFNTQKMNEFFLSRRSVRNYSNDNIDISIIKNAIYNALYGTPTVCNRPINKVHIITDYEKRKLLLSYQKGNIGFGILAPVLLLVTANLENYEDTFERRSPYIGGGMFAQSIIYALHAENLATCCLNWDIDYQNDIAVRDILNLNNETVIMYIAVGNYKNEDNIVAFSDKPDLSNIMIFDD
jgi:nitroreductase